jgi:hypothetical protein
MVKNEKSDLGDMITDIFIGLCGATIGGIALAGNLNATANLEKNNKEIVNDTTKVNDIDYLNNHKFYYFYIEH